jgi:hypothetical protein
MARGRGVAGNRKLASPAVDSRVTRAPTPSTMDGVQIVMV